ncbi:MAG: hypothetical protein AAFV29_04330, partial [Myxococcota bacterium]
HGVEPQRLYKWRYRFAREGRPASSEEENQIMDLVPVHIRPPAARPIRQHSSKADVVLIRLPSGASIEVPASRSPTWLATFVRALEER